MKIAFEQPSRKRGLWWAGVGSALAHAVALVALWYYPLLATALGLRGIEFVDEEYDRAILIDFSKRLSYPPGYEGFRPPETPLPLDEIKKREEQRKREIEARRRARARDAAARRAAEEARRAEKPEELAQAEPPAKPKSDIPGGFGRINTAPIRDQVKRLYEANQTGRLPLPEGRLRVGVTGKIRDDGSLADCRVYVSSGREEIDRAALAILESVSASRALGPLAELTSLTMLLDINDRAELSVVGFTSNEQAAANIVNIANAALLYARIRKAEDPAAMLIINNLRVTRTGQRVQALITMPRSTAAASLARTMGNGKS